MKVKLGDIFEIGSGGTPSKSHPEYYGGDIPWVKTGDLKSEYLYEVEDFITEEGLKNSSAKLYVPDTVLIAMYGATIGATSILKMDACTNQACAAFKKNDKVIPEYLYYFLKSQKVKFVKDGVGGAQPNISAGYLKKVEMELPSLDEQRAIVEVLDKTTNIMVMRNQEIASLDNLIKARFVELFGDLANPKCQWKKEKLVDACKNPDDIKCGPFGTQLSKDEYCSSGVAVWEIPQINSGFATQPTHFLTDEKANQLEAYSIKSGDIAMSRKGNVGRCAVFPETMEDGIIHSDVLRIRIDNDLVLPVFMMHQLHYSGAVQHQIELVSSGAIMAGINVTKLKQIEVHIPPLELQQQFAVFVAEVNKSKVAVQKALDETQKLFDSLMQRYFG